MLNDDGPTESVLPHPGFVYCCKFHPRFDGVIVTGGFDQVLRVWEVSCGCNGGQVSTFVKVYVGHRSSIIIVLSLALHCLDFLKKSYNTQLILEKLVAYFLCYLFYALFLLIFLSLLIYVFKTIC